MTGSSRARLTWSIGAFAAVGVVVAHRLAYWLVTPDAHERGELLASSGHRYFTALSVILFGLLVVALTGSLVSVLTRREGPARRLSLIGVSARLATLQTLGWFALEGAERLLAQHHHGSMFEEPVLWIGLAVQLLVALAGGLLFLAAARVVEVLLAPRRLRPAKRVGERWFVAHVIVATAVRLHGTRSLRGPPISHVTS